MSPLSEDSISQGYKVTKSYAPWRQCGRSKDAPAHCAAAPGAYYKLQIFYKLRSAPVGGLRGAAPARARHRNKDGALARKGLCRPPGVHLHYKSYGGSLGREPMTAPLPPSIDFTPPAAGG